MGKNTSIALSPYFEGFINEEVDSGKYQSASEVIREGLRLLVSRKEQEKALIKSLEEGMNSGRVENFEMSDFIDELIAKRHSS